MDPFSSARVAVFLQEAKAISGVTLQLHVIKAVFEQGFIMYK
jgi:hypothetical protein